MVRNLCVREVTIITNLSNHIPIFTMIDMMNVAAIFVRIFLNQNNWGEITLHVIAE